MKIKTFLLRIMKTGKYFVYRLPSLPKKMADRKGWGDKELLEMVSVKEGILIRKAKR